MNQQNGYNAWAAMGLQWLNSSGQSNMFNPLGQQQAALGGRVDLQQAGAMSGSQIAEMQRRSEADWMRLLKLAPAPETKESRAQRMAQEVRERKRSMQVQRRTRREA